MRRTQEVIKELAAVLIRVEAVIDVGLEAGIDVAVVEFAIENEEYGIYQKKFNYVC
jgi:hypothetical protein